MFPSVQVGSEPAFAPHPERRLSPRRRGLPWFRLAAGSIVMVAVLAVLAEKPAPAPPETEARPVPAAVVTAPEPVWQPVTQPAPLYALDVPAFRGLPVRAEVLRSEAGDRRDTFAVGSFAGSAAPYLHVSVERTQRPQAYRSGFFIHATRQAAETGLAVARSAQPAGLATRFGVAEVAEIALAGAAERTCLAFRFADGEVGFRLSGWLCGTDSAPAEPGQLACALGGLGLARGADDAALKVMFVQARRRGSETCAVPADEVSPVVTSALPAAGRRPARAAPRGQAQRRP